MQSKTIAAAVIIVLGVVLIALLYGLAAWVHGENLENEISLPLLAIAGVLLMIAALALSAIAFAQFDLDDKSQALALPEGSVRAVIALALVLLFAILSVYLYGSLAASGSIKSLDKLSASDINRLLQSLPQNQVIQILDSRAASIEPTTSYVSGHPNDGPFTIRFFNPRNSASDDFARQLLVMIGTLVTSVASFYFGSRAASSGQGATAKPPAPVLRKISPQSVNHGSGPNAFELEGDSLNGVISAKIVFGNKQIAATHVVSNVNLVKCEVDLTSTGPGSWDVVVTDAFGQQGKLTGGLNVT